MATERRECTQAEIDAAWEKAIKQPNNNPDVFRKDYAGAWIRKSDYGETTDYGWEIDHLIPLAQDGTYSLDNLIPMHWRNNRTKGDDYPQWRTSMTSDGVNNIEREQRWEDRR